MLALDLVSGAIIVAAAAWGLARGLTASTVALLGFGIGAVAGARLAALLLPGGLHSAHAPEVALLGAILGGAIVATLFERVGLGGRSRAYGPALVDQAVGAMVGGAVGVALVWILGAVVVQFRSLRGDVRRSAILGRFDSVVAPPGPRLEPRITASHTFHTHRGRGQHLGAVHAVITRAPAVRAAAGSVVRIAKAACGHSGFGTGWIVRPGVAVTNAHVASGASQYFVQVDGSGPVYRGVPIWFNPKVDIALISVPALRGTRALPMAAKTRAGIDAAEIGFPYGRFQLRPAVLGDTSTAVPGLLAANIPLPPEFPHELYGRPITTFSGRSDPGNSGSPLLDKRGQVLATVFGGGGGSGLAVPNRVVRSALTQTRGVVRTGPCPTGGGHIG